MTNRDEWEFEYTAKTIAEAANAKMEFRQSRVEWWEAKQKELMQEVRESGIEVTESVAAGYSATTAMVGPQVAVRADLQKKLNECHQKIREHRNAVTEYCGWVQVLMANKEDRLKLKHSDWLYFFGSN